MSLLEDKLASYPKNLRDRLGLLSALIGEICAVSSRIDEMSVSLKWGQLSFATKPKTGTPVRIDGDETLGTYCVFVPCSTNLISTFRDLYPDMFRYYGNREIRLPLDAAFPADELKFFLRAALHYYSDQAK